MAPPAAVPLSSTLLFTSTLQKLQQTMIGIAAQAERIESAISDRFTSLEARIEKIETRVKALSTRAAKLEQSAANPTVSIASAMADAIVAAVEKRVSTATVARPTLKRDREEDDMFPADSASAGSHSDSSL